MALVADRLVLVNGLPGAGKTTLAAALAAELAVPLVSKDALKEMLADAYPAVPLSSFGPIAMETAWRLAAEMPGTVILESWWFRPRDLAFVKAGYSAAFLSLAAVAGVGLIGFATMMPETLPHKQAEGDG